MGGKKLFLDAYATRKVVYEKLSHAYDNFVPAMEWIIDLINSGNASVWEFENGYAVLSISNEHNERFLCVHSVEGKCFLNGDGFSILYQLALMEGCVGVTCESKKRGVQRILRRAGFKLHIEVFNPMHYEQSAFIPLIKRFFQ